MNSSKFLTLLVAFGSASIGYGAAVTSATFNGTAGGPQSFSSITIDDGGNAVVFTSFEYGTASGATGELYYTAGAAPADANAALSGPIVTDGVLNINGGAGSSGARVMFDRALTQDDWIVVSELQTSGQSEASDALAMYLVDINGDTITAVNFGALGAGGNSLLTTDVVRGSNGTTLSNITLWASAVQLSDFGAFEGDAYGIQFSGSSNGLLDPSAVMLATVPEPATVASLMGVLALGVVMFRRRRS